MTLLPRALSLCRVLLSDYNDTATCTLDISDCPSGSDTRTLWDILLSCALTLFACTWTAVHPNIPGIEERKIAIISRRLFLMIMALIAPELMITWSARQYFSAREAAEDFRSLGYKLQRDAQANDSGRNPGKEEENLPSHEEEPQAAETISDGHNAGEEDTTVLLPRSLQPHDRDSPESSASSARDVQALGWTSTHRFFAWMGRFLPCRNNKPNSLDSKEGENQFQGWTSTHGFFAWMGGFLLYENNKPRATLTPDELIDLIHNKSVDIPIIAEEDIKDRSKEDGLSKGIAILQLAWFIIQLAARYAEKLSISLLEIETLAVAGLTCITYGLWWKKPKDVRRPYIVQLKSTVSLPYSLDYEEESSGIWGSFVSHLLYPFESLTGIEPIISQSDVESHRAPFLGGYTGVRGGTVCLIGCISGMLFGGIHCMGWNFLFQGQMAWRVASLSIFCPPICTLIFYGLNRAKVDMPALVGWSAIAILITSGIVYVIARITLIVLMLMSLRSLPPGAYDTVAWTKFIPHYQ